MDDAATASQSSRFLALAYTWAGPLYDVVVWWGLLPLGGEPSCRREFARWLELKPDQWVASLCCGTGSMERVMLAVEPGLAITGVDLGRGQIKWARRKNRGTSVTYILADAARTGLPGGDFDRVLITLALHEMPRPARLAILREARRLCAPDGRVLAIEYGRPTARVSRLLRAFWWFLWVPGNPERATSRDLCARGLDNEIRECGLDVLARYTTRLEWIEGFLAKPRPGSEAGGI